MLSVRVLRPPLPVEVQLQGAPQRNGTPVASEPNTDEEPMHNADHGTEPAQLGRPQTIIPLAREEEAKRLRIEGRVRLASGPWELEEVWWGEEARQRDYWDIELENGGLYRLYRDRQSSEWFADGVYD